MDRIMQSDSVDFLDVEVTTEDPLDTQPVFISVGDSAWIPATWIGAVGTTRTARILIGTGGDTPMPPAGVYEVSVKVDFSPQIVVLEAGTLTVVEGINFDGCLWPLDTSCAADEWNALDNDVRTRALIMASNTMRMLTAYRVGGCPVVIRPCTTTCAADYGYYDSSGFHPTIDFEGRWVNSCGCNAACSCAVACSILLPPPVGRLIKVDVDGLDITADCRMVGNRLISTSPGDCPFPARQNLAAAPGADDTFTVTYLNSYPVDAQGAYAAGVLALEFARACVGGKKCRLPDGVTQVTRQGVSFTVQSGAFPNGLTGIREVDHYIGLWKPQKSPRSPLRIWSPDRGVARVER